MHSCSRLLHQLVRLVLPLLCVLLAASSADAQIATWRNKSLNTASPVPAFSGTGTITRGAGIAYRTQGNSYTSDTWQAASEAAAITANDFVQVTANTTGFTQVAIQFAEIRNNNGPTSACVYYSTTGPSGTFVPAGAAFTTASAARTSRIFDVSADSATWNNPNMTFRIYAWGNTAASGTWRLNNFVVGVAPIVTEVLAFSDRVIDITFSKPMGISATTVANYAVTGTGIGTLLTNPTSASLLTGTDSTYRLIWSLPQEMLGGQTVTVTASNVRDTTNILIGIPDFESTPSIGTPPTISSINPVAPNPTNANSANFTVTFSEGVLAVDSTGPTFDNFSLTNTAGALSGTSVTDVTGTGATRTVAVNLGSGDGSLRLDLTTASPITDLAGNPLATTFNSGTALGVDRTAPFVASIQRLSTSPTNGTTASFRVALSEPVTGFDVTGPPFDNLAISEVVAGPAGYSVASVTGSGDTYDVTINLGTGDGELRLDTQALASTTDTAGNALAAPYTSGDTVVIDRTAPEIASITRASASPTNAASVAYTVTFAEPVTGVDAVGPTFDNFTLTPVSGSLASPEVTSVSGSGSSYTVTVSTGTGGEGLLRLDYTAPGSILDVAGNTGSATAFTTGEVYTVDRIAPTVASITRVGPSPTNAATVDFTVSFTEPVSGIDVTGPTFNNFDLALLTGSAGGAAVTSVSGGGDTYTVSVSTGTADGSFRLDLISASGVQDWVTNPVSNAPFTGDTVSVDRIAPTYASIQLLTGTPSNASSATFRVTFSEPVSGVDASGPVFDDFSITPVAGSVTGAAVTAVTGSGDTYDVTIGTGTGDGTLRLDGAASPTVTDAVGNAIAAAFATGDQVVIDRTAPTVASITRAGASPTAAATVVYNVEFDEPVTGVDVAGPTFDNFSLQVITGSLPAAAITSITGSGTSYQVTVDVGPGGGELRLDLTAPGAIADASTNAFTGTYTTGQTYAIDRVRPTVSSIVAASANPTNSSSVDFTVLFSEPVTGVDVAGPAYDNFSITATGLTGAAVTSVVGNGDLYTVTVSTGTGDGTLRLDLSSVGSIQDTEANQLIATFETGETYTIDRSAPSVASINRVGPALTNAASVDFAVEFNESVTGIGASAFAVAVTSGSQSTASVTNVTGSGSSYTVTVGTSPEEGTIRLDLATTTGIVDVAGNTLAGGFNAGQTIDIDRVAPTLASLALTSPALSNASTATYAASFSEPVVGLDQVGPGFAEFTLASSGVTAPFIDTITGTSLSYTITVNTGSGDGTLEVSFAGTPSLTDLVGNPVATSSAAGGVATIDRTAPVSAATAPNGIFGGGVANVAFNATDANGVAGVSLYYRKDGVGAYLLYPGTFTASPAIFNSGLTGGLARYEVYTIATDNAGNVESAPISPDIDFTMAVTASTGGNWSLYE